MPTSDAMHSQVPFSCNDHDNEYHLAEMLKVLLRVVVVTILVGIVARESGCSSSKPPRKKNCSLILTHNRTHRLFLSHTRIF